MGRTRSKKDSRLCRGGHTRVVAAVVAGLLLTAVLGRVAAAGWSLVWASVRTPPTGHVADPPRTSPRG